MLKYDGVVKKKSLYQKWHDRFPVLLRTRDVTVCEVDPPRKNASWYTFASETITLVRGYGDDAESYTHELAHHLHLKILTAAQQVAWDKFWQQHRKDMPSRYARQNPAEGFAEAESYRVMRRAVKRVVKDFLAELVGPLPAW